MAEELVINLTNEKEVPEFYDLMHPQARNGPFPEEKIKKMVNENLSFSCRIKNELVGFVVLIKNEKEHEILIYLLAVKESHRRKGIATKLLQKSMENAKNLDNQAYFILHSSPNNTPACNLYKKCGFKIIKTLPDFYIKMLPKGKEREPDKNYDAYEMELK